MPSSIAPRRPNAVTWCCSRAACSAAFALRLGWSGWAVYLTAGNIVVNLYPILLQRYTRARLAAVLQRAEQPA